jgi:hypothetical protein
VRYYFRFRSIVDLIASAALTALIFSGEIKSIIKELPSTDVNSYVLSLFSISSSLLGFVFAASTFLVAHIQHERFEVIRRAGAYTQLASLVSSSIWRLLALTIGTAVFPFAIQAHPMAILVTFCSIWSTWALAALLWAVLRIYAIPLE